LPSIGSGAYPGCLRCGDGGPTAPGQ
jgi:hypothetical protein